MEPTPLSDPKRHGSRRGSLTHRLCRLVVVEVVLVVVVLVVVVVVVVVVMANRGGSHRLRRGEQQQEEEWSWGMKSWAFGRLLLQTLPLVS